MNKLFIVLLFIIVIVCSFNLTKKNIESFRSESINWGYNPDGGEYTQWDENLTRKIVGPDPSKDLVNNWQYNPENTQVDYKYYQYSNDVKYRSEKDNLNTSDEQNRDVQRLAPVTWASVGKNTNPMDEIVPVLGQETRVPDNQSSQSAYIIPNPSAPPKYQGPNVKYCW